MEMHLITSWYSRRRPGKFATIRKVQLLKVIDNRVTPEIELRARNYPIDEETLRVARETPHLVPQYIKDHPEKNLIYLGESEAPEHRLETTLDRILNHPETSNVLRNKESLTLKITTSNGTQFFNYKQPEMWLKGWFADGLYHYSMELSEGGTKLFSIKDFTTKKGWDFGTFREDYHWMLKAKLSKRSSKHCRYLMLDNCKQTFEIRWKDGLLWFQDSSGTGVMKPRTLYQIKAEPGVGFSNSPEEFCLVSLAVPPTKSTAANKRETIGLRLTKLCETLWADMNQGSYYIPPTRKLT